MRRLILTTSDSGAGHLKHARIADKVVKAMHRLVWDPVPAISDTAAFFEASLALYAADVEYGAG